jgi:hypothetical protein
MALNFPNTPQNGDFYTSGATTWQFDGIAWNIVSNLPNAATIPNVFNTISIEGQDNLLADSTNDTLTLVAGDNMTITTNATSDTITFTSTGSGGGGGEANQNAFSNVAVSGQSTVTASTTTDTFNLVAGSNITLVTDALSKSITITSTASGGSSTFNSLTDATAAEITIDHLFESAMPILRVDNVGTSAYVFNSHYTGNNPNLYAISATTLGFDLSAIAGHPFEIQDPTGNPYNTGLYHVATNGTVSVGSSAQGKDSGTLYWRIPETISGNYRYQCQNHVGMVGAITIKRLSLL